MATFESFKKTLTELFDWSPKPLPSNIPKADTPDVEQSNESKKPKNNPDSEVKNSVSNKISDLDVQN